jgi:hypothetical protein
MPSAPRLRIDHLYIVSALALASFVVALMPIVPHDFWWHMAIGRDIAATGQVPTADRYSWAVPNGTPYTYQSWLGELLLYAVHVAGGLPAVVWLRNILLIATWSVLAWEARRRSGSWRLAALAVGGLTMLTVNNMTMRPQTFSWLPFALFVVLLAAYRDRAVRGRALVALPLLMALWVNLHGAFILGVALVALTVVGETLRAWWEHAEGDDWARVRWLWIVAGATVLATLVNPTGIGVWRYVQNLLGNQPVQGLVSEWQPVDMRSVTGVMFGTSVLVSAGVLLRRKAAVSLTDGLLWAAFLWLALGGVRSVLWWAMLVWPLIVGALRRPAAPRPRRLRANYLNTALAGLILLLPLAAQPPFKPLWTLPPVFGGLGDAVPDGALVATSTPVQAVAWIRQHPLPAGARLFHDMGFGSYLIWALPQTKVYLDPRIELYPLAEWMRYKQITAACGYNTKLQELGVTHLLLDRAGQARFVAALERDAAWQTLYSDDTSVLYARTPMVAYDGSCTPQS